MMRYQPRIDPTRAALIYLAEPVVAAVWAWMMVPGRTLSGIEIVGAAVILGANLLAGRGRMPFVLPGTPRLCGACIKFSRHLAPSPNGRVQRYQPSRGPP